jgi:DHA2 family methylenomycin A resistance protein-like MFS transporter
VLFAAMCVGIFLVLLDVTALNVALPSIGQQLHAGSAELAWVVDGYAVPFATLLLVGGTVGDLTGHRRMVLVGLVVFGVGSLGCALAPAAAVLVAARAVQGVGAALLLPGTLAVITRAYPGAGERARAIGIWAAVGALAAPAGQLVGGLLVQITGWPAVFWLNVPLVAAAVLATVLVVPADRGDRGRRADPAGTLLAVVTLGAFVYAAAEKSLPAVPLGVAGLVAFVLVERRVADPMVPLELFGRRRFSLANLAAFAMNAATLGTLFILTQLLQGSQHRPAALAGLAAMPAFLLLALVGPVGGRLVGRYGSRRLIVAGAALAGLGIGLLALSGPRTPYLLMAPALVVWGLGLGLLTPSVVSGAVNAVPDNRAGLASAVSNTARQAGGAIGVAGCAAIAGTAGSPSFVGGFRAAVLCGAVLLLAIAVLTALAYPRDTAARTGEPERAEARLGGGS